MAESLQNFTVSQVANPGLLLVEIETALGITYVSRKKSLTADGRMVRFRNDGTTPNNLVLGSDPALSAGQITTVNNTIAAHVNSIDKDDDYEQANIQPTSLDDVTKGFRIGDSWLDATRKSIHFLFKNKTGEADWRSFLHTWRESFTDGVNPYVQENSSYTVKKKIIIQGGAVPKQIKAILYGTISGTKSDLRIVSRLNPNTIAEINNIDSTDDTNIVDLGTISNWPTDEEVIEIQLAKSSGGGMARLSAVIFIF